MKNIVKKHEIRKALNYDLYSKNVEKYYHGNSSEWNDIKCFFIENGFEDRQYSGVISKKPISYIKTIFIIKKLSKKYPWCKKCIRRFDMTSIENEFDMIFVFDSKNKE